MRPHAILLLLCSLVVADAGAPACDISYIQGVASTEFTFKPALTGSELTCTDGKVVQHDQKSFVILYCGNEGWRSKGNPEDGGMLPVKADEILNIQCATACDKSLITLSGFNKRIRTWGGTVHIDCESPSEGLKFIDAGKEMIVKWMSCNHGRFWMVQRPGWNDYYTTIKDTDPLVVSCAAKKDCDESLVALGDGVKRKNNKITCTNTAEKLKIHNGLPKSYSDLTCNDAAGWTTSGDTKRIQDSDDFFGVKCGGTPICEASLVQLPASDIRFIYSSSLSCHNDKYIEYNQLRFRDMGCDEEKGWTYEARHPQPEGGPMPRSNEPLNPPVKGDEKLNIKCVDACHKSLIIGFDESKMHFRQQFELSCKADEEWLVYTENGEKKLTKRLICFDQFWSIGDDNWYPREATTIQIVDTFTASCDVRACHELWISVGEGVKRDNNKLTCFNSDQELLIDGDSTRYSDLTCAKDIGWTTGGNQAQIKKDGDEFSVKCLHKPCSELLTSLGEGVKRDNNRLNCTDPNEELQIDNDQTTYNNLTCTKDIGWTIDGNKEQIKKDYDQFSIKCVKQAVTEEQKGDKTAVFATIGVISALLLIAGIVAVVVYMRKRRNAPEIKPEPTKEAAKSKDAPSSGAPSPVAPSPVAPSPAGGVPSSN